MSQSNKMIFHSAIFCLLSLSVNSVIGQSQDATQAAQGLAQTLSKTSAGVLSASVDGMSRYIAPDGPIQPALSAISSLPIRGMEYMNRGLSYASLGLQNRAQNLAKSAYDDGQVRMPGMESLRQSMPSYMQSLTSQLQSGIRAKNGFIWTQAERGHEASKRMNDLMKGGLQAYSQQQ